VLLTPLNVPLMLKPSEVTTATQATTIKANITAYSTAVGPSSLARKRRMQEDILFIWESLSAKIVSLRSDKKKRETIRHRHSRQPVRAWSEHYEPRVLLTELKVPLMLLPREVTTATQATTIKANITAYSTAVGPSSLTRKRRTFEITQLIACSLFKATREAFGRPV